MSTRYRTPPQLTAEDCAANVSGGSVSTVYKWMADGRLPSWKPEGARRRYVRRADLAKFLGVEPGDLITAADLKKNDDAA